MDYPAIVVEALALLQQEKHLSYRVLQFRLQLDDETLEALKEDLMYAKQLAVDEGGKVLVWMGASGTPAAQTPKVAAETPDSRASEAEVASSPSCSATSWTRAPSPSPPLKVRPEVTFKRGSAEQLG